MKKNDKTRDELLLELSRCHDEIASLKQANREYAGHAESPGESEIKYKTIFDQSIEAIGVSKSGTHVMVNNAYIELFGYENQDELLGRTILDLIAPHEHEKIIDFIRKRANKDEVPKNYITRGLKKDGTEFYMDVHVSGYEIDNEVYTIVTLRDITERKRTEELILIQRNLAIALNSMFDLDEALDLCLKTSLDVSGLDSGGIYLLNQKTGELDLACSTGLSEVFIREVSHYEPSSPGAKIVLQGIPMYQLYEDLESSTMEPQKLEGLRALAVLPIKHDDDVIACMNVASHVMDDIPQQSRYILEGIAAEIGGTISRLKVEQELANTKALLESVMEQSPIPMVLANYPDHIIRYYNDACREILGVMDEESKIGMSLFEFNQTWEDFYPDGSPISIKDLPLAKALMGDSTKNAEYMIKRKDGTVRWEVVNGVPIYNNEGDLIAGFIIFPDITERKMMEEKLKDSLREKEILLKEIHHRVKNNMQIISSLVSLQCKYIHDDRDLKLFNDTQNRIQSMARIHEKIYQSDDVSRIDFDDYIKMLIEEISLMYSHHDSEINTRVKADGIYLGIDKAIPAALIINELVTNAYKYAFIGKNNCSIVVEFVISDDKDYVLRVSDNGSGLSHDFNPDNIESLGLKLVYALTRQLKGRVSLERGTGTEFVIVFPSGEAGGINNSLGADQLCGRA